MEFPLTVMWSQPPFKTEGVRGGGVWVSVGVEFVSINFHKSIISVNYTSQKQKLHIYVHVSL